MVNRKCYTPDGDAEVRPTSARAAINVAVEVIGNRWSLLLLRDVMFGNRRHVRILRESSDEGIASNILADRLRRLVADGLLTRAHAGRGHRAEYSPTEAAIQLVPVMAALGRWGARHCPTTPSRRVRAKQPTAGGPDLWNDFMTELRAEHPPGAAPAAVRAAICPR
jgi:DNA-binding HxlR family transcriptional regulator